MLRNEYRKHVSSTAEGGRKYRAELVICDLRSTRSDKALVKYVTIFKLTPSRIAPRYVQISVYDASLISKNTVRLGWATVVIWTERRSVVERMI